MWAPNRTVIIDKSGEVSSGGILGIPFEKFSAG